MVRMSEGYLWCVHTIRFSELTKNLKFGTKMIMQNLSVSFIFQRDCPMKIEHNEVCGYSVSSYVTSILNINVIQLLRYHCGYQGNQATKATGCVASRHCPEEPPYQI